MPPQIGEVVLYETMEGHSLPALVRRVWKDGSINLTYVDPQEKHQHAFGRNVVDKANVREGTTRGTYAAVPTTGSVE